MSVWQDSWVEFYREILEGMGADKDTLEISFPSIETDVPYRQITSLSQAFQMGGLHREEVPWFAAQCSGHSEPEARGRPAGAGPVQRRTPDSVRVRRGRSR